MTIGRTARDNKTENAGSTFVSGGPAVLGSSLRPEALRPYLSIGLPFSVQHRLYHFAG